MVVDLERAGRRLVADPPAAPPPVGAIRSRAARVERRRRGLRAVALALPLFVAALATTLVLAHGSPPPSQRVVTSPGPSSTTSTSATSLPGVVPAPSAGVVVSAARLVSAHLGLAATFEGSGQAPRLWLTADSVHWKDITPTGLSSAVEDVYATDADHIWATSWNSANCGGVTVWRTTDGGSSWSSSPAPGHNCAAGSTSMIRFVDRGHGFLVDISATGPSESLYGSDDGGRNWSPRARRLPEYGDVSFFNPLDGYLGGFSRPELAGHQLYATHDGGRTWSQVSVSLPPTAQGDQALYGAPSVVGPSAGILPVTLVGLGTRQVAWYGTTDGGHTWLLRSLSPATAVPADPLQAPGTYQVATTSVAGPSTWWVLASSGGRLEAQVTDDGGATWTTVTSKQPATITFQQLNAVSAKEAWLGGYQPLLSTTDGGASWSTLTPSGP